MLSWWLMPNLGLKPEKTEFIHQQTKRTVVKCKRSLVLEDKFSCDYLFLYCLLCRLVSFLLTFWAKWIHHDLAEHGRIIYMWKVFYHETQKMSDSVGWKQKRCLHETLPAFVRWMGREARYPRGMMRYFNFSSFAVMDPQTVASGFIPGYALLQLIWNRVYGGYISFTTRRTLSVQSTALRL